MKLTKNAKNYKTTTDLMTLAINTAESIVRFGKVIWTDEEYKYEPYFVDDAYMRSGEIHQAYVYFNTLKPSQALDLVESSYNKNWLEDIGIEYPVTDYDCRSREERAEDFEV